MDKYCINYMKNLSRTQFNAAVPYSSHLCFDGLEFIGGEIEWDLTFRFLRVHCFFMGSGFFHFFSNLGLVCGCSVVLEFGDFWEMG